MSPKGWAFGCKQDGEPVRRRFSGEIAYRLPPSLGTKSHIGDDLQVILHTMVTGAVKATDGVVVEAAAVVFAASGFIGLAHSEADAGAKVLVWALEQW